MDKTLDLDDHRAWLARQLLDDTLSDDEAFGIVAFSPVIKPLIAAARPAETRDWSEFEDEISDAISDSIDMDWSSRDGARAVVAYLKQIGAKLP